jgi:predicted nucleotidyltransferase
MLEHIFGSKAKIKILRKICNNPNRDYTVDDISKEAKIPYGTAHPAVHSLIRTRILNSKKTGHSTVVSFNNYHVLAQKIIELLNKESNAYIDIAKNFVKNVPKKEIKNIILFGSVVKGEILQPGDIDILIIYKRDFKAQKVEQTILELMERYDVLISPLYISEKQFQMKIKKFDSFILHAIDEGIVLYGEEKWLKK